MAQYRIVLPNDYNSEADYAALQAQFPELDGADLETEAWEYIHSQWPGLTLVEGRDFGGIFDAPTPPPADLPCWVWHSLA